MAKKVLIFWEEIPRSSCILTLEVEDVDLMKLESFHNHYVNGMPEEDSDVAAYESIVEQMKIFFYEDEEFKFEKDRQAGIVHGNFDLILRCGLVC